MLWLLLLSTLSCGGGKGTEVELLTVTVQPSLGLAVGVGDTVRFRASVADAQHRPLSPNVTWTTGNAAVATVDAGGLVTASGPGTTTVVASADSFSDSAILEVWVPAAVDAYQPGTSYYGRGQYVEYIPGDLPLVISAPHGGALEPTEIANRTGGTTVTDSNANQTALAVRDALVELTGHAPHVILSHLKRTKLDPNREIAEAAEGNLFAEQAWREYHAYIEVAEDAIEAAYGSGFYIDLHGHGHEIARAELGYLLSASDLERSDAQLDAGGYVERSSIRDAADRAGVPFSQLLRGSGSLGDELARRGVAAVPGPDDPFPGASNPYFSGGYDTDVHGSRESGRTVSAVQIELPLPGIRDTDANRRAFGHALAAAVQSYMLAHWGFFAP